MKSPIRFALALVAASLFAPAQAQEVIGTLTVNQGTVMTSTGGEFASATTGEAIQAGEQIMVSEGGSASVTFNNGVVTNLTTGVHTISGIPAVGAGAGATAGSVGTAGGASVAATAGVIAGTAAAVAAANEAANDGDNETPDQPVSR